MEETTFLFFFFGAMTQTVRVARDRAVPRGVQGPSRFAQASKQAKKKSMPVTCKFNITGAKLYIY
jgi:hypothetical protein